MEFYNRTEERTGVQEQSPYRRRNDVQCDFVMVYGIHDIKNRVKAWKKQGYVIHLMTGVAWGEYQDYLYGKFDGIDHHDEGQVRRDGKDISHGIDIPYMVPSISFSRYLTNKLKVAVDAGVEAIHLEEPEFWAFGGYSEAFKREWYIYYKEPWQDQATSADAMFRSGKLKQYLYTRMLDRLCSELKEYALVKYNRLLRFYVPTHSLISYTQISMVSPESALLDLPGVDGYIAQIWTGTARTINTYEGNVKERTFETAFLEYGIMQELVRGTDRRMWFLHDPIEDNARYTWSNYRYNYYRTVTASLMHPEVYNYEVCPWPNRVFMGKYPTESGDGREVIPKEYETNLLTIMHALRDMKQPDAHWMQDKAEVGLLLADSAMFQRMYPDGDDRLDESRKLEWNPFFGLALPLLKHGLAVRPVQLDNIRRTANYLDAYRVLVLSYEFMKPEYPDIHNAIATWVRNGGVLVYVGDGGDCFHQIRQWWNTGAEVYANPAGHLFECMGFDRNLANGVYAFGGGYVCNMSANPADIAKSANLAGDYRSLVRAGMDKKGIKWDENALMIMRRGSYTLTAVLDETDFSAPHVMEGAYVDMYTTDLEVVENPTLEVGSVGFYYNLDTIDKSAHASVIAAAARVEKFTATARSCTFTATANEDSNCVICLYTKRAPKSVSATVGKGKSKADADITCEYDAAHSLSRVKFVNSPDGVNVRLVF